MDFGFPLLLLELCALKDVAVVRSLGQLILLLVMILDVSEFQELFLIL